MKEPVSINGEFLIVKITMLIEEGKKRGVLTAPLIDDEHNNEVYTLQGLFEIFYN